ncbi:MAG TPA: cytochrome c-type biogenesis protein [Acetobacteraceae bacterium]|nr:cytochrome c-type biogenesis protein [Acetobacteraceae bacterium]
MKPVLLALLAWLLASPVWAPVAHAVDDPSEMLANPVLERRAEQIGDRLRCLVCQNESIEQSSAGLARDLRHIVRQKVTAGWTDRQVVAWMVARYGTFVELRPPFEAQTLLLWGAPVLALATGAAVVGIGWRARATAVPLPPLSDTERARLDRLTGP